MKLIYVKKYEPLNWSRTRLKQNMYLFFILFTFINFDMVRSQAVEENKRLVI